MVLKRDDAIRIITERIAWLVTLCELRGAIHLFDSHTISHDFYCKLLNEIYDLQLVVMDRLQANFPAIDLGDVSSKQSFQITAEKSRDKIQTTLDKYIKFNLSNKFGKLRVLVIGKKQGSYENITIPPGMTFVPADDIIDTKQLIKIIEGLDTEKLERIAEIVQAEIETSDFPAEIFLHVSPHNELRDYWPGTDDARMSYVAEEVADEIAIRPFMPYLDKMAAGGPIDPLRYITPTWCPFDWSLPTLDFKLLNRTAVPFLLAEAVFEVEQSRLDPRPVVVVKEDVFQAYAGSFWLVNEGPTSLEDVVIRFDLLPGKVPAPAVFPNNLPFEVPLGKLEDEAEIPVDGAFAERGVIVEELSKLMTGFNANPDTITVKNGDGTETVMTWAEHEKALKVALGPFQEEVGTVVGEIAFVESSTCQKHAVRFRAVVYIFNQNRKGLPRPPSAVYHVELETTGTNYKRHVADFSHEIKPGETDRFLIKLQVKQSSNHRFRVTFRNVDGQVIQSPWIRLQCFVPRTRRGTVAAEKAPATTPDP